VQHSTGGFVRLCSSVDRRKPPLRDALQRDTELRDCGRKQLIPATDERSGIGGQGDQGCKKPLWLASASSCGSFIILYLSETTCLTLNSSHLNPLFFPFLLPQLHLNHHALHNLRWLRCHCCLYRYSLSCPCWTYRCSNQGAHSYQTRAAFQPSSTKRQGRCWLRLPYQLKGRSSQAGWKVRLHRLHGCRSMCRNGDQAIGRCLPLRLLQYGHDSWQHQI
jgi:hypothetical protein